MRTETGLLLDTHVWIWLNNRNPEMGKKTIAVIDEAAQQGCLYISAISIWELATLSSKGRLTLRSAMREWIEEALRQPGIALAPLKPEISIESTLLPGNFHGDPADRIIVATARIESLTLITQDRKILAYSRSGHIRAIKP